MLEEFFVPPSSAAARWTNRAVSVGFTGLPYLLRRRMLRRLLNGEAGVRWIENYLGEPIDFAQRKYEELQRALAIESRAHWIGCCSGREVATFAGLFPDIEFTASDQSESIVRWCSAHYAIPNLRFARRDITQLTGDDGSLVVSLGVLTYLDAREIRELARRRLRMFAAEPVSPRYQPSAGTTYRGRMAWNHPYEQLFECTSFERTAQPTPGVIITTR